MGVHGWLPESADGTDSGVFAFSLHPEPKWPEMAEGLKMGQTWCQMVNMVGGAPNGRNSVVSYVGPSAGHNTATREPDTG